MEWIFSAILLAMAVACQWFLVPESATVRDIPSPNPREKGYLLLWDLSLLLASLVPAMPVMVRWLLLFASCVTTTILFLLIIQKPKSVERRACVVVMAAFLFIASFHSLAYSQWMEEQSLITSGELCSFHREGICYSPSLPMVEIGDSGTTFIYMGAPNSVDMGTFARNTGFRIERGEHGIEITTPLLDRSGKKILTIEKNHWTVVPPPGIWDKNYTENALEVRDSRGDVVFQIRFLPDRVQISAEWRDQFGHGQEWVRCSSPSKNVASCISMWGNPQTELQNESVIEPIFQYPSKEHLGEFAKKN